MIGFVLLFALQAVPDTLEAGLAAFRAGRYEDAVPLLQKANADKPSYAALVNLGIAQGRLGHLEEAGEAFDRAIALEPSKPEAFVERGGLRFLQKNYPAAISDLKQALVARDDAYARDLLASSLYLAGRTDEALQQWNRLNQPELRSLVTNGLVHTKDKVVRRELVLAEGGLLERDGLKQSELRLSELGIFDRISIRPVPLGEGKADLEISLVERHGLFSSPWEFVTSTGINALLKKVHLRYSTISGEALNVGGEYRWESNRPEASVFMDAARPLGLPAYLRLRGASGRQEYDVGTPLSYRYSGLDLSLRSVFGSRSTGSFGLHTRQRSFSRPDLVAPAGTLVELGVGLERRVAESFRQRLDASAEIWTTLGFLGSDLGFVKEQTTLSYKLFLSEPEGSPIEPSLLAARVRQGWGGSGMPVDEMFAPGGSPEMELPLRAHPALKNGILGAAPIGRSLLLVNMEWRKRLANIAIFQLGSVLFYDGGRIMDTVSGSPQTLHDIGVGLRLTIRGSSLIRFDYGHGLSDGKNAFFIGLGQVF